MDLLHKIELRLAALEVLLQNLYARYFIENYHLPVKEAGSSLAKAKAGKYQIGSLQGEVDAALASSVRQLLVDFFGNNLSIVEAMQNQRHNTVSNENLNHNEWFGFFERQYPEYNVSELSEVEVPSSDLVRRLWLNNGNNSKSFIIKELPDNEARRYIVKSFSLFDREICFYNKVAPKNSISAPNLLHYSSNPPYLILEDMGRYISGDQEFGYTIEEAKSVIDQISHFHAFWKDSKELVTLPIPRVDNELISSAMPAMLEQAWDKLSNYFNEGLGYDAGYYVRNLIRNLKSICETLCKDKITLLHGDLRLDNILFEKYEAKCFLDWQMMAIGSPMIDVAYFVSQSGTAECQTAARDYALNTYAEKFYNGDLERIRREYSDSLLLNLSTPILAALGDIAGNDGIRDIVIEAFRRAMTHIQASA